MTSEARAMPPAQRTLPAMLQRQAEWFGSRPLLRMAGREWTHRDAAHAAAVRAGALAEAGVVRGDRIAVMCGNRIEFLETFLGAGWMGASVVPVNTASMGPQVEYFLANSEAKLLVIEAGFLERLATADLGRTSLREVWVVGEAGPVAWQALPAYVWFRTRKARKPCHRHPFNPAIRSRFSTRPAPPGRPRA